jgi:hypothetical protein
MGDHFPTKDVGQGMRKTGKLTSGAKSKALERKKKSEPFDPITHEREFRETHGGKYEHSFDKGKIKLPPRTHAGLKVYKPSLLRGYESLRREKWKKSEPYPDKIAGLTREQREKQMKPNAFSRGMMKGNIDSRIKIK